MKIALVILSLVAVLAFDNDVLFVGWKDQFNKVYDSEAEESLRFENFKLSLDRIRTRNAINGSPVFGLTKFSDLSPEEFKSFYLGYKPPAERQNIGILSGEDNLQIPNNWDWRNQQKVTPVKNQGKCISSYAMSIVENIESLYCIKHNIDCTTFPPLSTQQVVDCDFSDEGCSGGGTVNAYIYVIQQGMEYESDYPYSGLDGNCNYEANKVKVTITNWEYATQDANETTMQTNLFNWGPLSICVNAAPWQDYTGGILMASACNSTLNHCVELVGYDMTPPTPFWSVRNGWGSDWGENGYIRLQYGKGTCGCADEATTALF